MQSLRSLSSVLSRTVSTTTSTITRSFSSTPATLAKSSRHRLETILADVPPYPYPIKGTFKQHWFGLYGGRHIIYGNKVSEKDEKKHRRSWKPNLKHTNLYSETLGRIKVKVVVGVLRTIDKVGGLDNYLLGSTPARLKELGPYGWSLRWKILKHRAQRKQLPAGDPIYAILGLGPKEPPVAAKAEKKTKTVKDKKTKTVVEGKEEAPVEVLSIPQQDVQQGAVTL